MIIIIVVVITITMIMIIIIIMESRLCREACKDDWGSKQQAVKQDMLSQNLAAAQEQAKMAMF